MHRNIREAARKVVKSTKNLLDKHGHRFAILEQFDPLLNWLALDVVLEHALQHQHAVIVVYFVLVVFVESIVKKFYTARISKNVLPFRLILDD